MPQADDWNQHRAAMYELIVKNGRAVSGVKGDDGGPAYLYTIGNMLKDLPEICVIGVDYPVFGEMMDYLSNVMLNSPGYTEADFPRLIEQVVTELGLLVDGKPLRAKLVQVSYAAVSQQHFMTHEAYGMDLRKIKMLQLLWADDRNILPDEPGYNSEQYPQTVFAVN